MIAAVSLFLGVALSGLTYFIEKDYRFGWPYSYYMNEPANCTEKLGGMTVCETAFEKFSFQDFAVNVLIWFVVLGFFIILAKLYKNKRK
jgi:hypothetical protein